MTAGELLREIWRRYVASRRLETTCGDLCNPAGCDAPHCDSAPLVGCDGPNNSDSTVDLGAQSNDTSSPIA